VFALTWVVEVEDLVKEFNGRRVLNEVSFRIGRGEVFGLLGPNGAGKTTTLRIILGLLKPTSGKALVLGGSLNENPELRRRIGVVLEGDGLFLRLSARENLDFYARIYGLRDGVERKRRIRELLELVGLGDVGGLKVGHFSRGMRRRLALARALVHNPEVLFLDEPTSGLDPEARVLVRDLVVKLSRKENVTVLYTSHVLSEVERICNKVALLVRGKIIARGRIDDLTRSFSGHLVEVRFADSSEVSRALRLLKNLDYVLEYSVDSSVVRLIVNGDCSRLLNDLVGMKVRVEEIRRMRKSLEEVYLELVRR